jgi:hypothetical protein
MNPAIKWRKLKSNALSTPLHFLNGILTENVNADKYARTQFSAP